MEESSPSMKNAPAMTNGTIRDTSSTGFCGLSASNSMSNTDKGSMGEPGAAVKQP
jgi:hypothetical protein